MEAMLPLAHAGHYIWILYVIPVLVVAGSIALQVWRDRDR
jgi:heme exporter protein D